MIQNALREESLPVCGDGSDVRDWIYVEDNCRALDAVFHGGMIGEVSSIGGRSERSNLDVIRTIYQVLDETVIDSPRPYGSLIAFVTDRHGHDFRYAIDSTKIEQELDWGPGESFESGLQNPVGTWPTIAGVESVRSGEYLDWIDRNYGRRAATAVREQP